MKLTDNQSDKMILGNIIYKQNEINKKKLPYFQKLTKKIYKKTSQDKL